MSFMNDSTIKTFTKKRNWREHFTSRLPRKETSMDVLEADRKRCKMEGQRYNKKIKKYRKQQVCVQISVNMYLQTINTNINSKWIKNKPKSKAIELSKVNVQRHLHDHIIIKKYPTNHKEKDY